MAISDFSPISNNDDQDSFTNTSDYVSKISITLPPAPTNEEYIIKWYCESYSSGNKFRTLYRIYNSTDATILAEATAPKVADNSSLAWVPLSGFAFVTPDPNNYKTIEFQFKTENNLKSTAKIRRARLMYQLETT